MSLDYFISSSRVITQPENEANDASSRNGRTIALSCVPTSMKTHTTVIVPNQDVSF